MILVWFLIYFSGLNNANAQYLFEDYERLTSVDCIKAADIAWLGSRIAVFGVSANALQGFIVQEGLNVTKKIFELKGMNEYKLVKVMSNLTHVLLLCNIILRNISEIPNFKSQIQLSGTKEQGLVLILENESTKIISSEIIGSCLIGNKTVFTGYRYGTSTIITSKSTCSGGKTELDILGQPTITLDFQSQTASSFILNNYLYIISFSMQLSLSKYDLYLTPLWSTILSSDTLIDFIIQSSDIYLLTTSSFFKLNEDGSILFSKNFPSHTFQKILASPTGFYLISQSPQSTLTWLSSDLQQSSQRLYSNITSFTSILQQTSETFIFLFTSNKYPQTTSNNSNFISFATQPFIQTNCHQSCLTCFGASNSSCISCKHYEVKNSINGKSCGLCYEGCDDCFGGSRNECYSCLPGFILFGQKCFRNLSCPLGSFQNLIQEQCQSCDQACFGCTGKSFNDCLACASGFLKDGRSCVVNCPVGKFNDSGTCKVCDDRCIGCFGDGFGACIECKAGYLLHGTECIEKCPERTWKSGVQCLNCVENCDMCLTEKCLRCEDGFFNIEGNCIPCASHCKACLNTTYCVNCDLKYSNKAGICTLECNNTSFSNGIDCISCDTECLSCSGLFSSNCTSCTENNLLYESNCIDSYNGCPDSYFESLGKCLKCGDNCLKCNNEKICKSCERPYVLKNGVCEECNKFNCPCSDLCEKCDKGRCLKCNSNYVALMNDCVEYCPEDYNDMNGICMCKENCIACNGNNCVECLEGLELNNASCVKCSEGCLKCYDETECVECSPGKYLNDGKCVQACPAGSTISDKICVKCPSKCKKCQPIGCVECVEEYESYGVYVLVNNTCSDSIECIKGYKYSPEINKCEKSSSNPGLEAFLISIL